jgi:hypothetical protein
MNAGFVELILDVCTSKRQISLKIVEIMPCDKKEIVAACRALVGSATAYVLIFWQFP